MLSEILVTKLYIPTPRSGNISRPRLLERLDDSLNRKLTLVSAPAGFGKTTLISEWVHHLGTETSPADQNQIKVSWISLDKDDSDPARFFTYLIAGLKQAGVFNEDDAESMLSMLRSPQTPPLKEIATSLINLGADQRHKLIIVLDDYHLIESALIQETMQYLIEYLPPQLHLLIATREDPPLPMARLKANRQMMEIRAVDLRFEQSEIKRYIEHELGIQPSSDDLNKLDDYTEGWISGLHLMAISLQGQDNLKLALSDIGDSKQFVLDYLLEEVLNKQTEETQTFLLQTAILDRLNGSLCDAVTEQENGKAMLEHLHRSNLFLVPLDKERNWYRYHHLFADLLRLRLNSSPPQQIQTLHLLASEWFERSALVDEAIEHALRAGDLPRAAGLIEADADNKMQRGELIKLRRWLGQLPREALLERPNLGIIHAYYLIDSGQQEEADRFLQSAEKHLSGRAATAAAGESLPGVDKLRGRLLAARAQLASFQGNVPGIIQHAQGALNALPEQDLVWRGRVAILLGDIHGFMGDMEAAYRVRSEAVRECKVSGDIYTTSIAYLKLAITLREQGCLQETIAICQKQMQLAHDRKQWHNPFGGRFFAVWGETLAELNDLDGALDKSSHGVALTEKVGNLPLLGWNYMCLMRVLYSRGDLTDLAKITARIENLSHQRAIPPWVANLITSWRARIGLEEGRLEVASRWAAERGLLRDGKLQLPQQMDFFLLSDYLLLARILFQQGRFDDTGQLLTHLLQTASASGRTSKLIEILLFQALFFETQQDSSQANTALAKALSLAEPGGFIRVFVDEGPAMAHLLYKNLEQQGNPAYMQKILAAFPEADPSRPTPSPTTAVGKNWIEPLSEREIEVLQLIAEGLSRQEIASRLVLSLNTVKTHIRNIYSKLGTHNQINAVRKARGLGILDPD